jgi:hypothetical protein
MRHHHEGAADAALDGTQLEAGAFAQVGVERRQRLVQQDEGGAAGHSAGQCHALLLAAGKLCRAARLQPVEAKHRDQLGHAGRMGLAGAPQAIGDVLA